MELLGREEEQHVIRGILNAARDGGNGVLVLRGEPGIGKTSLLDHAVETASDFLVLQASGLESESNLGMAGLHRLLLPLLGQLDRLPNAQQEALGAAFGLIQIGTVNRFLTALGALTLLSDAKQPVFCCIDDAQWLDEESQSVLAFVARRLHADRVAMIFSVREESDGAAALQGLPELELTGLSDRNARRLVMESESSPLDHHTVVRVIAEARGNPLALVELGEELTEGYDNFGLLSPEPMPVGPRIEARFLRQIRMLPADTQEFLLVLAAEPGDESLIWRAVDRLRVAPDAWIPASEARLILRKPELVFRHPLIRSALYGAASDRDRRHVHAVLADLIDPSTNGDRRAWHLAAAAVAPDEDVAGELERSAERAKRRGGWSSQAAFLSRAAELTPNQNKRTERLLAACQAALVAGAPNRVRALLKLATKAPNDALLEAKANRIHAGLHSFTSPGDVPVLLLDAARVLERYDVRLARDTYAEALQSCVVSWQLTRKTTPREVADAALAAPRDNHSTGEIVDLMIDAFATRYTKGLPAAVPLLRDAVTALCSTDTPPLGNTRWAALGNNAAADIFDAEGYRSMLDRLERAERESGALESLRVTLGGKGHSLMWAGDFVGANSAHSEAAEISLSLGEDAVRWEMLKIELMAWEGRESDTRVVAGILTGEAAEISGAGIAANLGRIALVILEMSKGHYGDALVPARLLMEDDPPAQGSQVLPEVVEAAVRSGHPDLAAKAMARLTERAQASVTPWACGLLARSRALIDEKPEPLYQEAISHLRHTNVVTDLARAHLLYGEWLRRQKRRSDARAELRVAHSLFSDMGATAFAERARGELAATGERAKQRADSTRSDLTDQERQVAVFASQGLTNSEIAANLFLSAATVDYHLRKVYRKLDITSRRQLRRTIS